MLLKVVPAYGRDYKSKKAAQADWDALLDFVCSDFNMGNKPINKADALNPQGPYKFTGLQVRYKEQRMVANLRLGTIEEVEQAMDPTDITEADPLSDLTQAGGKAIEQSITDHLCGPGEPEPLTAAEAAREAGDDYAGRVEAEPDEGE